MPAKVTHFVWRPCHGVCCGLCAAVMIKAQQVVSLFLLALIAIVNQAGGKHGGTRAENHERAENHDETGERQDHNAG